MCIGSFELCKVRHDMNSAKAQTMCVKYSSCQYEVQPHASRQDICAHAEIKEGPLTPKLVSLQHSLACDPALEQLDLAHAYTAPVAQSRRTVKGLPPIACLCV